MHKKEDAKFLEMVVSNNDMRSFVCETRKDLQLFLSEVDCTPPGIHCPGVSHTLGVGWS